MPTSGAPFPSLHASLCEAAVRSVALVQIVGCVTSQSSIR